MSALGALISGSVRDGCALPSLVARRTAALCAIAIDAGIWG